ncbi:ABC transporter ATP-binding protein [Rhizobium sp. 16-449-1b]|uniref:ABC transporter ATP-binding protein n=1 Tax=Rhizobium sp. 16-449-1b TaxID=2819989 RepID=UPI001ADC7521|nr:ABC transporter ATP-binding protein [Rhizobium sp. 16-449-1b]MBO9195422.1 ABC transporter ATP-binding protein [Rhizobium sp. 16-449-1b]
MNNNNLLTITNLQIEAKSTQGRSVIIDNVNLTLKRGEVLGLIGESGAGKSTLGLAAAGFVKPGCKITGGSVRFDGKELVGMGRTSLESLRGARIAYVAQSASASFNPAFKLAEQCAETAVQHRLMSSREARERVQELFTEMMLPEPGLIGFRYPHQVSGGQLQRAMTAMAMVCRPDLIIFDEPTTALDVTTQVGVLASIRAIVEHYGTAAIYVTHDLAVVSQMAHRIMVMRNGKAVEEAPTREMLANPKQEYTKSLWAVRNFKTEERARPDDAPLMSIRNLDAFYANFKVLDDISFDVPKARTVAIVGESGSGKSTLARVITGLLPLTSGAIKYNGRELPTRTSERSRQDLQAIQMIHQYPDKAINPKQRIGDVIARPLRLYSGLRGPALKRRVFEIMELLELDAKRMYDRFPHELSGGQKQRVCIGRALAASPKLIICDEVTSALDQVVAEGILKTLVNIQKTLGVSFLIITHDIGLVQAIADEVVVLKSGKIIEAGSKTQVLSPPYADYTQLLLSSTPEMDPDWLTNLLDLRAGKHVNAQSA